MSNTKISISDLYLSFFFSGSSKIPAGIIETVSAFAFYLALYYYGDMKIGSILIDNSLLLLFIVLIMTAALIPALKKTSLPAGMLRIQYFIAPLAGFYSPVNVYRPLWIVAGMIIYSVIAFYPGLNKIIDKILKIRSEKPKKILSRFLTGLIFFVIFHIIYSGYRILPFFILFFKQN